MPSRAGFLSRAWPGAMPAGPGADPMLRLPSAVRRSLWLVAILLGITLVGFLLLRAAPGMALPSASAWYMQYPLYLGRLARGEFGFSVVGDGPVLRVVLESLPGSLALLILSLAMAGGVSVSLALTALRHEGRLPDRLICLYATLGLGTAPFWLGLVLAILLAELLPIFPASGFGDDVFSHVYHLILPSLAVALLVSPAPILALRQTLVAAMESNHVTAMRAQGLDEEAIYRRHVRRNALLPAVGALKDRIAWLVGTAAVVEAAFKIPGLGSLMVQATLARDYPTAVGALMAAAVGVLLLRQLFDLVAGMVDPRAGRS
jgi:peptide/nickel transport system permease protein